MCRSEIACVRVVLAQMRVNFAQCLTVRLPVSRIGCLNLGEQLGGKSRFAPGIDRFEHVFEVMNTAPAHQNTCNIGRGHELSKTQHDCRRFVLRHGVENLADPGHLVYGM